MKLSAILAPLVAAGVSAEVILETVRAWEGQQSNALEKRRDSDARRKAAQREKEKSHVTSRDTITSHVTASPSAEEAPSREPVFDLPTLGGGTVSIIQAEVDQWGEAFPALDIMQQLASMRSWLNANPKNGKTIKGIRRFAVSWLGRAQNNAPRQGRPAPAKGAMSAYEEIAYEKGWDNGQEKFSGTDADAELKSAKRRGEYEGTVVDIRPGPGGRH